MPRYRNTGERRVWPTLTDQATGRTLELAAGQEGELAGEVDDPYLDRIDDPGTQPLGSVPFTVSTSDSAPEREEKPPVPAAEPVDEHAAREQALHAEIAAAQAELDADAKG
jgi:hypothetical protein